MEFLLMFVFVPCFQNQPGWKQTWSSSELPCASWYASHIPFGTLGSFTDLGCSHGKGLSQLIRRIQFRHHF